MILYSIGLILSLAALFGIHYMNIDFGWGVFCAILGIFMMQFGNHVIRAYDD